MAWPSLKTQRGVGPKRITGRVPWKLTGNRFQAPESDTPPADAGTGFLPTRAGLTLLTQRPHDQARGQNTGAADGSLSSICPFVRDEMFFIFPPMEDGECIQLVRLIPKPSSLPRYHNCAPWEYLTKQTVVDNIMLAVMTIPATQTRKRLPPSTLDGRQQEQ